MILKPWRTLSRLLVLAIILTLIGACSKEKNVVGTYRSLSSNPPEFANLYLELKSDGAGIRRINGKDLPFRWVIRGHQVRIHTKSGGTIVGHIWGDFLVLRLPGPLVIYLIKVK
jgi:hypothetical protein